MLQPDDKMPQACLYSADWNGVKVLVDCGGVCVLFSWICLATFGFCRRMKSFLPNSSWQFDWVASTHQTLEFLVVLNDRLSFYGLFLKLASGSFRAFHQLVILLIWATNRWARLIKLSAVDAAWPKSRLASSNDRSVLPILRKAHWSVWGPGRLAAKSFELSLWNVPRLGQYLQLRCCVQFQGCG